MLDDERASFHDPDITLGEITAPAPLRMDGDSGGTPPPAPGTPGGPPLPPVPKPPKEDEEPIGP